MYLSFDILDKDDFKRSLIKVENCVMAIKRWMTTNMLKFNGDKTEVVFITSKFYQQNMTSSKFMVDETEVTPTKSTRNLGIIFDCTLSMDDHISAVCRSGNFQLRELGKIRKLITFDACSKLVHAFVTSRLDYGNSLLSGLPDRQINRLQRVLNTAARIVSLRPKFEHITPVLMDLHWLPVAQRIKFKVLLLAYQAYYGLAPSYLCEIFAHYEPKYNLRSSVKNNAVVNATSVRYGDRAFHNYGPKLWNSLEPQLRQKQDSESFKGAIKTLLFREAYAL